MLSVSARALRHASLKLNAKRAVDRAKSPTVGLNKAQKAASIGKRALLRRPVSATRTATPTIRSYHVSTISQSRSEQTPPSSAAAPENDIFVPAIPWPHETVPNVPLRVPRSDYILFRPGQGSFWPIVGMKSPSGNGKFWLVVRPPHLPNSFWIPTGLAEEPTMTEESLAEVPSSNNLVKTISEQMKAESDATSSTSTKQTPPRDKSAERTLTFAMHIQPVPTEYKGSLPFGSIFQTRGVGSDEWAVTSIRRATIDLETGDLEIAALAPSSYKYGIDLVWPEELKKPDFAATFTHDSIISSETDPNIVDASETVAKESELAPSTTAETTDYAEGGAISFFDSAPEGPKEELKDSSENAEPQWVSEQQLTLALQTIRDILKDALYNGPAHNITPLLQTVDWNASTPLEVNDQLDRITWLMNGMPDMEDHFHKMLAARDVLWRSKLTLSILRTRFLLDPNGYTTAERKRLMEELLKNLNNSPNKMEARQFIERYRKLAAETLPENVINELLLQINKLTPGSAEFSTSKRYLDFVLELPWKNASKDVYDLKRTKQILDQHHYGMEEVKARVTELLAVSQLTKSFAKGKVLALIGPPGTGKTTIASSIAESLGRSFGSISVGGLWDISDLKGHRRTYLASMAGQLLRTIHQCKTKNPVILLDEVDKLARGSQVTTALLEILDPAQQAGFTDVWVDLPFDISNVLFICTANWEEAIHPALKDRLEVVTLEGYLEAEKIQIAKLHLIPKCMKTSGLTPKQFSMTEGAIKSLVKHYNPLSPGVRDLETQLQSIVNGCSLDIARGNATAHHLNQDTYEAWLPRAEFHRFEHDLVPTHPGCASALTQLGVQQVEAVTYAPKEQVGSFHTTGNLDEVMKESAQLAYTYLTNALRESGDLGAKKSSAKKSAADASTTASSASHKAVSEFFSTRSVHMHLPKGGQSKGGTHAGACVALALLSLALNKPIPAGWAITGELTLLGRVLPVPYLKRMIHAAQLHRLKKVIIPTDNKAHWDELPDSLKKGIEPHFVTWFHEISHLIFKFQLPDPRTPKSKPILATQTSTPASNSSTNSSSGTSSSTPTPSSVHKEAPAKKRGSPAHATTSSSTARAKKVILDNSARQKL